MTLLDWIIVIVVNGSIIGYGLYLARGTQSTSEWFLAARTLPWWAVGLSMFATNVDNADLVAVTGQTYYQGIHVVSVYAIGSALGAILAAFFVVPAISRRGFYTNAEYLEARYSPATRILSAIIQIQYRTSMLGMMIWSTYLVLTRLVNLSPGLAWAMIVLLVILSGLYTAFGGLKSVVWTDSAQGIVMMIAAAVIFITMWNVVGGWSGLDETLNAIDIQNKSHKSDLLHIGRYQGEQGEISPYFIVLGWTIVGCGYWTVNHTQTMRLMGARSVTDMKYAALFGVALSLPVMIISASLGVFAHGIEHLPVWNSPDELYPILAKHFLTPGLLGIVVAGMIAAVVSTFDSMGSALSAIFTRDIYARLFVPNREDAHYVMVGRLATAGILLIGFAYLPFIWQQKYMLKAFTTLIPVFVTPLLTIYLMGVFTRVHRSSGIVGLICGGIYGVSAFLNREFGQLPFLPYWFTESWVAYTWSIGFTMTPMLLVTGILGRENLEQEQRWTETGWLERSRDELPPLPEENPIAARNAAIMAVGLLIFTAWVVFGWLW